MAGYFAVAIVILFLAAILAQDPPIERYGVSSLDGSITQVSLAPLMVSVNESTKKLATVYVMNTGFESDGILFAFGAFWLGLDVLSVQIWRPVVGSSQFQFEYISNVDFQPDVVNQIQTIYIASSLSKKCLRVKKNDRLGFFIKANNTNQTFSLKYQEDLEKPYIFTATGPEIEDQSYKNQTDSVYFKNRTFSYRMNFIAYSQTSTINTNDIEADCPKIFYVDGITTLAPVTFKGDPGPIGDTGISGLAGMTGQVGYTGNTGLPGDRGNIGEIGVNGATGETGATGFTGFTGVQGGMGMTGLIGYTGEQGQQGVTGPPGLDGADGVVIFINNTVNDTSPYMEYLSSDTTISVTQWKSKNYMIGVLIWLSVLSVIIIISIIVLATLCAKFRKKIKLNSKRTASDWTTLENEGHPHPDYSKQATVSTLPSTVLSSGKKEEIMDTMRMYTSDENLRVLREDTFKDYTNEMIF